MGTNANTITTMGIIADEVYSDKGQPYFIDLPDNPDGSKNYQILIANGTTYEVIDHISLPSDMQALLLKSGDHKR